MHPILRLPPVRQNKKYNYQGQHTGYRQKCTQVSVPFVWRPTDIGQWSEHIQRLGLILGLFVRVKRSEILKFIQFELLVVSTLWPCENNFFLKTVRNVFTISNTKAEISHGSALLLGEKEKKGWLLPQATWQIGSNGFAWCPKKAAQDKYWQYKRWVSHVFS